MAQAQANNGDRRDAAALDKLMKVLWLGVLAGALALVAAEYTGLVAAVGIGILIFLAAFAAGCFLGFLFGLPRVPQDSPPAPAPASASASLSSMPSGQTAPGAPAATAPATRAKLLQSNTNLERISDWLTTMLVGATLVEIHNINDALLMFRDFLQSTATVFHEGGKASAGVLPAVGPIVLVFGAVCGFLYMYLNTRLVLVKLFAAIEKFLSTDTALPEPQQRAVAAFAHREDGESFVQKAMTAKKNVTVEDALNLMFDMLYKGNPEAIIDLGTQLSTTDAVRRPDYWFYLAAAFGQRLHRTDLSDSERLSARDNALDCARRAVAIDPSYRNRLWSISDPQSSDDDLAPLRNDPEFLRIVGRAPAA
ncbi:MAG TPA: hypothetical protein VH331_04495 [Allosphingosinicella sp.]|jgi:hypothetical protein|nr:hypothetical protein [Allosphingosinicella sp.]